MPVFTPGSTKSASNPKNFRTIVAMGWLSGGTTDETIAPSKASENVSPMSCRARIPYSSDVRSRAVASRHELTSALPRKTPRTMFVLPTSMTRRFDTREG